MGVVLVLTSKQATAHQRQCDPKEENRVTSAQKNMVSGILHNKVFFFAFAFSHVYMYLLSIFDDSLSHIKCEIFLL